MRSYMDGMLRYFEFSGRSTRMQYWMFFLIHTALIVTAIYLDVVIGEYRMSSGLSGLPATVFVCLVHAFPAWTLQVRRLHDVGRSGWWLLLNIVPLGGIFLLVWACTASDSGDNGYGPPSGGREAPRDRPRAPARGRTTIPRQVRMGSARTPSIGGRRDEPSTGRFI